MRPSDSNALVPKRRVDDENRFNAHEYLRAEGLEGMVIVVSPVYPLAPFRRPRSDEELARLMLEMTAIFGPAHVLSRN